MDTWNCEWVVNDSTQHDSVSTSNHKGTASCSTVDSPCTSKDDSNENCLSESSELKINSSVTKPTFKSVLQAKKRLQAFSAVKQLKRSSSKDDKTEDVDKTSSKKSKKALYPLDKAQAVVQEIEEIKQKQVAHTQGERTRIDCTMAVAYKTLSLKDGYHGRSRSSSSDREMQFKKREIKSRNYRRSDSFRRRSASPENRGRKAGKYVYPQNWTEYKQQGLTLVKDEELRSKLFPKQKHDVQQLVTKLLTLDGPCPIIESFKSFSVDEKLETIPLSFLRVTRSKPTLLYSINSSRNKYSFVSRKQLFDVVSKERRSAIEKLINSASSKPQFQNRTLTSRLWYSKSWKKSADAECKILENSVGLSFLQTYSDEEEDNENEESITTKDIESESKASQKETSSNQLHNDTGDPTEESGTLTPEDKPEVFLKSRGEINRIGKTEYEYKHDQNDKSKKEEGTPERATVHDLEEKTKEKNEVNKTKKAIKELEQELERRKAPRMEDDDIEEEEAKRAKKKKKKKKKESSSDTEEESEKSKKKRKKKVKTKKKKYVEDDDESSSDNETSKRAKKRNRRKKEKLKQKKYRSKKGDSSGKEGKAKKKEEEVDVKANEDQRKKRKSQEDAGEEIKKTKIKGKRNAEATGKIDIPNEDLGRFGRNELAAKKEERLNEDLKKFHDSSLFKDLECSLKSNSRSNVPEMKTRESLSWHEKEEEKRRSIERDAYVRKDSRRSRFDREISEETAERRSKERSKEKYRWKELDERKADRESSKSKRLDESRRSDENFDKADVRKERKSSKDKQEESSHHSLKSSQSKTEPDWEDLRIKRDKHRSGDYKEPLINFCDGLVYSPAYPAKEHDRVKLKEGNARMDFGTPDTEEYRENWEKDSYPIWESEDEAPAKRKVKLNSSWESDEEIFERSRIEVERESARPLNDIFDLEIPLNIKPFKRREPIDPDTELLMLKKQRLSISEERRMLEIEKLRVKELEMEVIMEVEGKEMKSERRQSKDDEKREENLVKRKERLEKEALTLKRGRWDKRSSSPKAPESKPDNVEIKKEVGNKGESSSNVSSTNSGNTSAVLENEYEEFMKALTTSPKKTQLAAGDEVVVESSPSGSTPIVASTPNVVKMQIVDTTIVEPKSPVPPPSTPQVITILPKDIPLIPMPLPKAEIKPVPVPSPQIEIDAAPKPLINLSLSANITLDIAPKFTTPPMASPLTSTNCTQAATGHSPALQGIDKTLIDDFLNFTSPLTDTSVDSIKERTAEDEKTATNKPFVFTGMVLPSKRQLLNNSVLNLDDSDDDERRAKPMKKLEEIIKENEIEGANSSVDKKVLEVEERKSEREQQRDKEKDVESKKSERRESLSKTSQDKEGKRRKSPERHSRKESPPRRSSYGSKRDPSPRRRGRESPGRRRGHSPRRHSPRRRPSPRRRSPAKRRHSPRRSLSPKSRRRASLSPRRKQSPRRSKSPKNRGFSPRKVRPKSPERHASSYKSPERHASSYKSPERHAPSYKPPMERPVLGSNNLKSPTAITSPMEGLKRSVADSTISDELLLQRVTSEEYAQSPVTQFYEAHTKSLDSPKRESLDARINQVLGMAKEEPRPIPTTYSNYSYAQHFPQQFVPPPTSNVVSVQQSFGNFKAHHQQPKRNFVQVGNMVQILPTEDISMVQEEKIPPRPPPPKAPPVHPSTVTRPVVKIEKSQIVQVGNMLQIVPTDIPSMPPLPPEPEKEPAEPVPQVAASTVVVQEKQSAESVMRLKVAERREEREKRRQERERRRKEKEKRRREKEKERQIKLKQRTENMIKRALELEAEGLEDEPESILNETPAQWPPVNLTIISAAAKEVSKSILVRAGARTDSPVGQRRKVVQFADGIKPGEGTSPSGGEDLSSPPPRKKLDKAKRPKKPKSKQQKKSHKKKVKVKIIKKRLQANESDEEDDLPPPSPPPGSPPPHVFPPRVKPPAQSPINNIQPYLTNVSNVVAVQPGHGQLQSGLKGHGQQQLFRAPQLNLIMHPPPHGPPHLLPHGPPPPPPHILHHGPPPPPGPPLFQHGPPPPPPHQHQGPPPPPPGALHLPPPHFHR